MSFPNDPARSSKLRLGKAFKSFGIVGIIMPIVNFIIVFVMFFGAAFETMMETGVIADEDLELDPFVELVIDLIALAFIVYFGFKLVKEIEGYSDENPQTHHIFSKCSQLIKWALILDIVLTIGLGLIMSVNIPIWLDLLVLIILLLIQTAIPVLYLISMKNFRTWGESQPAQNYGYAQQQPIRQGFQLAFIGYIIMVIDRILVLGAIFAIILVFLALLTSLASYIIINAGLIKAGNKIMESARGIAYPAHNAPPTYGNYRHPQYGQPTPNPPSVQPNFPSQPLQPPSEATHKPSQSSNCKTCGKAILLSDKFCNYCGTKVPQ